MKNNRQKKIRTRIAISVLSLLFIGSISLMGQSELVKEILEEKARASLKGYSSENGDEINQEIISIRNSSEEVYVSEDISGDWEMEPFLAVNPTNENNIVASYIRDGSGHFDFPMYYSFDCGQTWEKSEFDTEAIFFDDTLTADMIINGGGDPIFAFDNEGKLFFSWIYLGTVGAEPNFETLNFITYWAESADGGVTWTVGDGDKKYIEKAGIFFDTGLATDFGNAIYDRPWFAVDKSGGLNNGNLYCTGLYAATSTDSLAPDITGIALKRKLSGKDKFDEIVTPISEASEGIGVQFGSIKVDNSGRIHVLYGNRNQELSKYAFSDDGGLSFSQPTTIGTSQYLFSQGLNRILVLRENPSHNLAVDISNNNLYAVWGTTVDNNTRLEGNFVYSHDGGTTWSDQQSISELVGLNEDHILFPNVASDNNEVSISWQSVNQDKIGDYMIINSKDGGIKWSEPQIISGAQADFNGVLQLGDYYGSTKIGCNTHSVWSDARAGFGKVYYSTTNFCDTMSTNITEIIPLTDKIRLNSVFPNPTKNSMAIELELKERSDISISILTVAGHLVKDFGSIECNIGVTTKVFDVSDLTSSMYIMSIKSPFGTINKRINKI